MLEATMDLLRISRDVYGREVLEGISWDLLPVFFWGGIAIVCAHALYSWLLAPKHEETGS